MQEVISVYINLTDVDLKSFYCEKNKILNRSRIIVFTIMLLLCLSMLSLLIGYADWYIMTAAVFLVIILDALFMLLPLRIHYKAELKAYKTNYDLMKPHVYKFSRDAYTTTSASGSTEQRWELVDKVRVLKDCVLIYPTSNKINLIPKRCFSGEAEFEEFLKLITTAVTPQKLKIKDPAFAGRVGGEKPATIENEQAFADKPSTQASFSIEPALLELTFKLSKQDLRIASLTQYYVSPKGILITLIGLLLSAVFLWDLGRGAGVRIMPAVGLLLTAASPVFLVLLSDRMYQNERLADKGYTYRFYDTYFSVAIPGETIRCTWGNLFKISKTGNVYQLYISDRAGYVIPKRIIRSLSPDEREMFYACLKKAKK